MLINQSSGASRRMTLRCDPGLGQGMDPIQLGPNGRFLSPKNIESKQTCSKDTHPKNQLNQLNQDLVCYIDRTTPSRCGGRNGSTSTLAPPTSKRSLKICNNEFDVPVQRGCYSKVLTKLIFSSNQGRVEGTNPLTVSSPAPDPGD